jgi:hypothetical protein
MDIRFDAIKKFINTETTLETMQHIRNVFKVADELLNELFENEANDPVVKRAYALARTNLEISSFYAIKAWSLLNEDKKKE